MNDVGKAYQDIQSHPQPLLQIIIQSWIRLGICFFFSLGCWGSFLFFASVCFLPLFFKRSLLGTQPSIERVSPAASFALQSLFCPVSAVGFGFLAEILEDGRVAVERKKQALSAPTVLCPKLRRKLDGAKCPVPGSD
jgi:hypothetical protein